VRKIVRPASRSFSNIVVPPEKLKYRAAGTFRRT
jgi:hypothetical protein